MNCMIKKKVRKICSRDSRGGSFENCNHSKVKTGLEKMRKITRPIVIKFHTVSKLKSLEEYYFNYTCYTGAKIS